MAQAGAVGAPVAVAGDGARGKPLDTVPEAPVDTPSDTMGSMTLLAGVSYAAFTIALLGNLMLIADFFPAPGSVRLLRLVKALRVSLVILAPTGLLLVCRARRQPRRLPRGCEECRCWKCQCAFIPISLCVLFCLQLAGGARDFFDVTEDAGESAIVMMYMALATGVLGFVWAAWWLWVLRAQGSLEGGSS